MNERFKFRVWDSSANAYVPRSQFILLSDGTLIQEIGGEEVIWESTEPEFCTGLKDKNSKLIYENDLIKCPSGIYRIAVDDFGLWTAIYDNNPVEGVVEWSDIVKNYAFNQNNVELEVLGNIHENADLIKVGEK